MHALTSGGKGLARHLTQPFHTACAPERHRAAFWCHPHDTRSPPCRVVFPGTCLPPSTFPGVCVPGAHTRAPSAFHPQARQKTGPTSPLASDPSSSAWIACSPRVGRIPAPRTKIPPSVAQYSSTRSIETPGLEASVCHLVNASHDQLRASRKKRAPVCFFRLLDHWFLFPAFPTLLLVVTETASSTRHACCVRWLHTEAQGGRFRPTRRERSSSKLVLVPDAGSRQPRREPRDSAEPAAQRLAMYQRPGRRYSCDGTTPEHRLLPSAFRRHSRPVLTPIPWCTPMATGAGPARRLSVSRTRPKTPEHAASMCLPHSLCAVGHPMSRVRPRLASHRVPRMSLFMLISAPNRVEWDCPRATTATSLYTRLVWLLSAGGAEKSGRPLS